MDTPKLMDLQNAFNLATHVKDVLEPHCDAIMIAGSIRRGKAYVKDIEIVCIPKRIPITDLFGTVTGYQPIPEFVAAVNQWERVKGHPDGKYTQRLLPVYTEGCPEVHESEPTQATIAVDIFMAQADNYGLILLIRTGSHEFGKKVVGVVAPAEGYRVEDGYLWRGKTKIPVPDEQTLFKLLNRRFVIPSDRV